MKQGGRESAKNSMTTSRGLFHLFIIILQRGYGTMGLRALYGKSRITAELENTLRYLQLNGA
jgi:hypothetical protein